MARNVDPLFHNTMLDGNLMNEVVSGATPAVNRMVYLEDIGDIVIVLPSSVRDEVNHPATPAPVRAAANRFIHSVPVQLTPPEIAKRDRLIREAKGNSQSRNVERDLNHVFEAAKYGCGQFVTRDE